MWKQQPRFGHGLVKVYRQSKLETEKISGFQYNNPAAQTARGMTHQSEYMMPGRRVVIMGKPNTSSIIPNIVPQSVTTCHCANLLRLQQTLSQRNMAVLELQYPSRYVVSHGMRPQLVHVC